MPEKSIYANKIVKEAHLVELHGGVSLTMTNVRDQYWIPRLRRMTKRVVKTCPHCRRFHAVPCAAPAVAPPPKDRKEKTTPFQVSGVHYAGPYKVSKKEQEKTRESLLAPVFLQSYPCNTP